MHDNRTHSGPNWTGHAPRTFREAFPHGAGLYTGKRPRRRIGPALRTLAAVLLGFLAGYVLALLGVQP